MRLLQRHGHDGCLVAVRLCVLATVVKGPQKYGRHPRLVDRAAKIATFF